MAEQTGNDVPPVACTLTAAEARGQLASWAALRRSVRHVAVDDRGATLWFDPGVAGALGAVVEAEAACCSFLALRTSDDRSSVRLDIESETDEGVAVAHLLASHAAPEGSPDT